MTPSAPSGSTVVVVGGGVIGTMHALLALDRGCSVVHIERELAARGASVRNFGLVWVGGRARGAELALAVRARELWEEIAGRLAGVHFRPVGSLTAAVSEAELAVMKEASLADDAAERQWELLDGPGAREANPELSDEVIGALYCGADAIVEPRTAVSSIREHLLRRRGYDWLPGRSVVELSDGAVRDDDGAWHRGDKVFICTGADAFGLDRAICRKTADPAGAPANARNRPVLGPPDYGARRR